MSTHQTLGSADGPSGWIDSFGTGLQTINISGHTGWNRSALSADGKDGEARFQELYDEIFLSWHRYRYEATKAGQNPDEVELIFIDNLDNFACVVAPGSFNLRRSKSRPLLMQYQIGMTALSQRLGAVALLNKPGQSVIKKAGLDSLTSSIKKLTDFLDGIKNWINTNILGPVRSFMVLTQKVLNLVRSVYSSITGITESLINVARGIAQSGRNVFQALAGVTGLPGFVKSQMMLVASEFSNVFCLLRNSLKAPVYYPDYTGLYGASNCSSTSGGAPPSIYAGENPFYAVAPVVAPSVVVQPIAQSSMNYLSGMDPVLAPASASAMASHMGNIAGGVTIP